MFKPTKEQVVNLELCNNFKRIKIVAGAGTGKAQPLEELVLTPSGFTTMGQIQVGDLVVNEKGNFIPVLEVYEHSNLNMYQLTFSDGSQASSCEDHLWEVKELDSHTGARKKTTIVRTLKELLPKILKKKKTKKPYPYSVRLTKPIEFSKCVFKIHPYLMGYTLGNGSSAKAALKIAVASVDFKEILSYISEEHILSTYKNEGTNVDYFNLSIEYRKKYEDYGLYQVKSLDKFIPRDYLIGSVEQRKELLQGLMDSDGSCVNNKCRFSSSSLQLITDVIQLVRSLGGTASRSISLRSDKGIDSNVEYNLSIRVPFNPFKLERKKKGYTILPTDTENDKRIVGVSYLGKQDGKCILVDSDRQLYITRDYTVTHNSSSLRYIAKETPDKNYLVLCFNSANAKESNEHPEKPNNIFYATVHSLAYSKLVDVKMKKKLGSYLDFNDLASLKLENFIINEDLILVRRTILELVLYFCRSSKTDIVDFTQSNLPFYFEKKYESLKYTGKELSPTIQKQIAEKVKLYWDNLVDKGHPSKITHDIYLKIYDLHQYKVDIITDKATWLKVKVQVIVLDEAQDSNPVTESIFNRQTHLQQIMVGDPMQQLYSWRGAGYAMDNFQNCYVGKLTESFRFNSNIARQANNILKLGGSTMVLKGSSTKNTIETRAILCRTNAGVLEELITFIDSHEKVYTSINTKDVFSKLYHIASCYANKKPTYPNKDFINIVDKKTLEDMVTHSEELTRYLKLGTELAKFGTLTEVKTMLNTILVASPDEANIIVSTGHASKGMEYDRVTIADDFMIETETYSIEEQVENLNQRNDLCCLLYVMITRAQVELTLPWYLNPLFE